jgi:hypothetical protein
MNVWALVQDREARDPPTDLPTCGITAWNRHGLDEQTPQTSRAEASQAVDTVPQQRARLAQRPILWQMALTPFVQGSKRKMSR